MKVIYKVKQYNERHPDNICFTEKGKQRMTGYVLYDRESKSAVWFPNIEQAKIERDTPGKYGPRGIKIY